MSYLKVMKLVPVRDLYCYEVPPPCADRIFYKSHGQGCFTCATFRSDYCCQMNTGVKFQTYLVRNSLGECAHEILRRAYTLGRYP
jgi:hypothetical protein